MFLCDFYKIRDYEALGDPILKMIKESENKEDCQFASHKWLLQSSEKRMMYWHLYGDLFEKEGLKILDVGGGYCSLSRKLAEKHDYTVMDIFAHDSNPVDVSHIKEDWLEHYNEGKCDSYDIVIANDLFPNVDQRLELFISRYSFIMGGCSKELRLSLTFYNNYKFYKVKRVDADEIFHILAWDGARLKHALEIYKNGVENCDLDLLLTNPPSLFANGRQVCILKIK
jgi:hypothetical protein